MNLPISRLREQDLDRAAKNCALFRPMPDSPVNLRLFLADERNILMVAEVNGQPVGQIFGYILQRFDARAPMLFLYSIDVVESHRRQGIGRRLIERFREIGRESGCGETFVFTDVSNRPAVKLYAALDGIPTDPDRVMFEWE